MVVIITAAGLSRRHPPNKLLHTVQGGSVIEQTITTFINLPVKIVVVTGFQRELVGEIVTNRFGNRIDLVDNPSYETGLAGSVRCGVKKVDPEETDYYLFCNGDRPFIIEQTVRYLMAEVSAKQPLIALPLFNGQPGHPTFFAACLRDELLSGSGDKGGRGIIEKQRPKVLEISVPDEGVILDMDSYLTRIKG